jgi:hypothetical protein
MKTIVKNLEKIEGTSAYTCSLKIGKAVKEFNALFSPDWSKAQVLEKIFEACRNSPTKGIKYLENGKTIVESPTNEGMFIKIISKENVLRTAYPIINKGF